MTVWSQERYPSAFECSRRCQWSMNNEETDSKEKRTYSGL